MTRMPGDFSTPPASPGKHLPESNLEPTETQTKAESQTTETDGNGTYKNGNVHPPKLTISTSTMQTSLASLSCATRLSPSTNRTEPNSGNGLELSVVLTPELLAVGELVAAMKGVVGALGTTFDSLGAQAESVASLAPALKVSEQIKKLRTEVAQQMRDQEMRVLDVKLMLEEAVKQTLSEELKVHIHATVEREVKDRVARQLNAQIPDNLRQQIKMHKRQTLEVQRSLHNSEARQHNSALGPAALTDELRPLLRPLPNTEQSPFTAKPGTVPPTPASVLTDPAPTASPLFPRDLKALFALRSEDAQTLVTEYGLTEQALPITPIAAATEPDSRERNLNKFMAHIGVVGFQMHAFPACTSSSPEDQSFRSPLIISVHPSI
ncbi:hypothetical protein DFH07DRAFT_181505 [Mycena maculata]|uniref:Uncharacterized protein n=1 Tax=Mycena maculata TaxID=230809 RepID=A0AAD7MS17_9AGAR|nr:hypothetical protein DFH07DRAFT_181505 [Mycena maculata]